MEEQQKNDNTAFDEQFATNEKDEQEETIEPEIDIIEAEGSKDGLSEKEEDAEVNQDVQGLLKDIELLKNEKEETLDRLLRLQAEFDNYKKRTQREKIADRQYKSQELVTELLPSLDNFERALQVEVTEENKGIIEGISMVYKQLKEALKSQGVDEIETVGKEFDPNIHHAVMQVEEEDEESNIVVEEFQKGYMLKDRVIRPAMVKVNK